MRWEPDPQAKWKRVAQSVRWRRKHRHKDQLTFDFEPIGGGDLFLVPKPEPKPPASAEAEPYVATLDDVGF